MKITHWINVFVISVQSGCYLVGSSHHESFIKHYQWYVGKTIQSFRSSAGRPESVKQLTNGNIEEEYAVRKGKCRFYYEYDPVTGIVVSWRFEGGEKECIQNPYT